MALRTPTFLPLDDLKVQQLQEARIAIRSPRPPVSVDAYPTTLLGESSVLFGWAHAVIVTASVSTPSTTELAVDRAIYFSSLAYGQSP
jgi:hypothetical protein